MPRHIAWIFPAFAIGGAQLRCAALINAFGPAARHTIFSLNGRTAAREKLDPSIAVDFPAADHPAGAMAAAILHARATLRRLRPDLVVTSNWGAIEWAIGARLAVLPHVHTEDGFGPEERLSQLPRRVLTRRIALRGSTIILPSQTLLKIARETWRLPASRLRYIPNGIDTRRFAAATPAPIPPGDGPVIVTIAALRPEKNIGRLIEAMALLRAETPARLVIAGDGPERPQLDAQAKALGIAGAVHFAGHTTTPETWLAAADIFALSSDTEQMPLSLLEAMAAGLPAVSTDVGDVRAMLSPENAPYIVTVDAAAMAGAFRRLLDADHRAIGAANRDKARRDYSFGRMVKAYWSVFGG